MSSALTVACIILSLVATFGAAGPSPAAWMPRVEDRTALWWVDGPPKVFQSDAQPKEETLCFQFGKEKLIFDTRRVRPLEGEWECALTQFWDQAAIGSFGESICFEPGRVQRRCFITDVRPLMTLPRVPDAKRWGWAENCGGGDFLLWKNAQGRYQTMKATRTDYRSHGPCLTDVSYSEETGGGEIAARMDVSVPAANDHLRTLLRLRYDARQPVRWQRLAFFQLGADFYNDVPARRVAIGDATGLREEWEPRRAKDDYDRTAVPLTGEAAWVSVHGVEHAVLTKGHAAASRGFIVRSWRAVLGGKPAGPHLSTYCTERGKNNHRTAVELAPPPGLTELQPGDFVEAELELVVFPADAAAYYGPDAALREMLVRTADTWRPVHREAKGNALKPIAKRGSVTKDYPLVVSVDGEQRARVTIRGGLGHPCRAGDL